MEVKIEKLIYEGWGIGHDETGRAIFVKKAVPGDLLDVKIIKDKAKFAEAVIEKVISPSEMRITPECPYFDLCGGCEHQNIGYSDQLKLKEKVFRETLARQGIECEILPIIQASEPFFYRNSIRFFLIEKEGGERVFTRHNYLYEDGFVEADRCLLQSEKANLVLEKIQKVLNQGNVELGSFYQVKIREGKFTNEIMIELITENSTLPAKDELVKALREIPEIKSIYHTITPAKSLRNLTRRLLYGSPIIYEKIGKFKFQISPDSFFQTNSLGVKTLYDKIKDFADIRFGDTVLDLYCGTGTIGIYLSTLARNVIGVEVVQSAVNDANANAKINKVSNCEFFRADATKWLNDESIRKFANPKIILDPPRAGLNKEIISEIAKLKIENCIYVSCNPATFARDIKEFEKLGMKLMKVVPLDMFPQTHHIECVGLISQ